MHACIHTHINTCAHACRYTYTHIRTYIHTYVRTYIHACMHACIHMKNNKYLNIYIYIFTRHVWAYTHTSLHMYVYIYIYIDRYTCMHVDVCMSWMIRFLRSAAGPLSSRGAWIPELEPFLLFGQSDLAQAHVQNCRTFVGSLVLGLLSPRDISPFKVIKSCGRPSLV